MELFQDLLDSAHREGEEIIAGLANQMIVDLDPSRSLRDKEVKGIEAIQQYFEALIEARSNGELLHENDVLRLGKSL